MRTFLYLVGWELRYYLTRVSTWVYTLIFAALGMLLMLLDAGAISGAALSFGGGGKVLANAPFSIAVMLPLVQLLGTSIVAAVAGNALYRDYDARMDPLVYTTPVPKIVFLGGRFVGTLLVNLVILTGIAIGMIIATKTPWVQADKLGPFRLAPYLWPYVTHVLPNLLFTASVFFALPALTRQMMPNYVGGVVLLIGYLLSGQYLRDLGSKQIAALLDPFGQRTIALTTEYWSIAERNSRYIPLSGQVAMNRAFWIAIGLGILGIAYARFRFAYTASERRARPGAPAPASPAPGVPEPIDARGAPLAPPAVPGAAIVAPVPIRRVALPPASQRFDGAARWAQFRTIFASAFLGIVRNRYFAVIVGAGVLYLLLASSQVGKIYGTPTWPVTDQMVATLNGSFAIFLLVIIVFYAGELVWAERDAKMQQIVDATPLATATAYLAKLAALIAVVAVLLLVIIVAGVGAQAAKGYTNFELPLYFQALFGVRFIDLVLFVVLAFVLHVLVNNKYVGHFVIVLVYLGLGAMGALGLERNLYQYASDGGVRYSDMNGWGHFLRPFMYWKLYWLAFAVLLGVLTLLFWVRGEETWFGVRAELARRRFGRVPRAVAAVASLAFIGLGGFLWWNTDVLHHFSTGAQRRHLGAEYERLYKKYERLPQPRITAIRLDVDLYPERRDARVRGTYVLRNRTASPIDTLLLRLDRDYRVAALRFDRAERVVRADSTHEMYLHRFDTPLAPGDSLVMTFDLVRTARGFANSVGGTDLVGNGTFMENVAFMPGIGYSAQRELADDDDRKKEHLPARARMAPPTAPHARENNYLGRDADWIDYEATVSTAPDQIAITSGYLQREWTANGRRYFHYKMDAPILDLWAFQSARYRIATDSWTSPAGAPVAIAVYYDAKHPYDVPRMIDAVKKSLAYYTANFGPYQHRQLRIVEFPYGSFAQSLPNTIPYSESVGFIARVESANDIDYPFYITAHEVAHQWWAHQVIGADAQGSTMLSETLAQYSALMVMQHEYGAASMRRFLQYELDRYLTGRSTERKREMPIELGENQPYIHYNKGSLVMYALEDYIGEQRMNAAIRGFLDAEKFRGPPYPTSLELVDSLRAATPDSMRYLITDLFEHITLYEMRADSAITRRTADSSWALDLFVTAKKLRADTLGAETEVPMNDLVDIGVYARPNKGEKAPDAEGMVIYLQKHRITGGAQKISLVLPRRPSRAGIDPLHKLIDRVTSDNTIGAQDRTPRTPRTPARAAGGAGASVSARRE